MPSGLQLQRLHEEDLAGVILKLKMGFVHLMPPREFEPEGGVKPSSGSKIPAHSMGNCSIPCAGRARSGRSTAYAIAGQYQQRPAPGRAVRFWRGGCRTRWTSRSVAAPNEALAKYGTPEISARCSFRITPVGLPPSQARTARVACAVMMIYLQTRNADDRGIDQMMDEMRGATQIDCFANIRCYLCPGGALPTTNRRGTGFCILGRLIEIQT
jgi:hypothetical protein